MRKISSLIAIILILSFTLSACGNSNNRGANNSQAGNVPTLRWITVGNGLPSNYDSWLSQLNPYLEEKIGVHLDLEVISWGDWHTRRNVIINSGEPFDLFFTDGEHYARSSSLGAFLDLTEYLDEFPALQEAIPELVWKATAINDQMFGVPTYKDSAQTFYWIWDQDVADAHGLDIEELDTFATIYPALQQVLAVDGGNPFRMGEAGATFLLSYYSLLGTEALGVRYDDDSYTIVNPWFTEDMMTNIQIVRQMFLEGIINGCAPSGNELPIPGTVTTAQGWPSAAQTTWGPNFGIENCVAVQYSDTILSNDSVRGSINAISSGSKYPKESLALLELINTDSYVRDLLFYGEEGVDFEYTEDGRVNRLKTDWPLAGFTQGQFFNVTPLANVDFNQWDEVKQLNEEAVASVLLGFNFDITGLETEIANMQAVINKYRTEFFTGAIDPEMVAKDMTLELEMAGWNRVYEAAQSQLDQWLSER